MANRVPPAYREQLRMEQQAQDDRAAFDRAVGGAGSPGGGGLQSVVAGSHISVDNTDPQNPVLAVTGVSLAGYPEGTAFPTSPTPSNNDKFYRTDLDLLFVYKSAISKWLTVNEYSINLVTLSAAVFTTSDGAVMGRAGIRKDFGIYMTSLSLQIRVDTTNNSTNYWTYQINAHAAALTNVYTLATPNTIGAAITTYVDKSVNVNDILPSTAFGFFVIANKTGTPGQTNALATLYYRLIGP